MYMYLTRPFLVLCDMCSLVAPHSKVAAFFLVTAWNNACPWEPRTAFGPAALCLVLQSLLRLAQRIDAIGTAADAGSGSPTQLVASLMSLVPGLALIEVFLGLVDGTVSTSTVSAASGRYWLARMVGVDVPAVIDIVDDLVAPNGAADIPHYASWGPSLRHRETLLSAMGEVIVGLAMSIGRVATRHGHDGRVALLVARLGLAYGRALDAVVTFQALESSGPRQVNKHVGLLYVPPSPDARPPVMSAVATIASVCFSGGVAGTELEACAISLYGILQELCHVDRKLLSQTTKSHCVDSMEACYVVSLVNVALDVAEGLAWRYGVSLLCGIWDGAAVAHNKEARQVDGRVHTFADGDDVDFVQELLLWSASQVAACVSSVLVREDNAAAAVFSNQSCIRMRQLLAEQRPEVCYMKRSETMQGRLRQLETHPAPLLLVLSWMGVAVLQTISPAHVRTGEIVDALERWIPIREAYCSVVECVRSVKEALLIDGDTRVPKQQLLQVVSEAFASPMRAYYALVQMRAGIEVAMVMDGSIERMRRLGDDATDELDTLGVGSILRILPHVVGDVSKAFVEHLHQLKTVQPSSADALRISEIVSVLCPLLCAIFAGTMCGSGGTTGQVSKEDFMRNLPLVPDEYAQGGGGVDVIVYVMKELSMCVQWIESDGAEIKSPYLVEMLLCLGLSLGATYFCVKAERYGADDDDGERSGLPTVLQQRFPPSLAQDMVRAVLSLVKLGVAMPAETNLHERCCMCMAWLATFSGADMVIVMSAPHVGSAWSELLDFAMDAIRDRGVLMLMGEATRFKFISGILGVCAEGRRMLRSGGTRHEGEVALLGRLNQAFDKVVGHLKERMVTGAAMAWHVGDNAAQHGPALLALVDAIHAVASISNEAISEDQFMLVTECGAMCGNFIGASMGSERSWNALASESLSTPFETLFMTLVRRYVSICAVFCREVVASLPFSEEDGAKQPIFHCFVLIDTLLHVMKACKVFQARVRLLGDERFVSKEVVDGVIFPMLIDAVECVRVLTLHASVAMDAFGTVVYPSSVVNELKALPPADGTPRRAEAWAALAGRDIFRWVASIEASMLKALVDMVSLQAMKVPAINSVVADCIEDVARVYPWSLVAVIGVVAMQTDECWTGGTPADTGAALVPYSHPTIVRSLAPPTLALSLSTSANVCCKLVEVSQKDVRSTAVYDTVKRILISGVLTYAMTAQGTRMSSTLSAMGEILREACSVVPREGARRGAASKGEAAAHVTTYAFSYLRDAVNECAMALGMNLNALECSHAGSAPNAGGTTPPSGRRPACGRCQDTLAMVHTQLQALAAALGKRSQSRVWGVTKAYDRACHSWFTTLSALWRGASAALPRP